MNHVRNLIDIYSMKFKASNTIFIVTFRRVDEPEIMDLGSDSMDVDLGSNEITDPIVSFCREIH